MLETVLAATAIALTVATVILGVVALVLAAFAFRGYEKIKQTLLLQASDTAKEIVQRELPKIVNEKMKLQISATTDFEERKEHE